MSIVQPNESPEVAAVRAALLSDLASIENVAAALGKNTRTIQRFIAAGKLPIVRVGHTPLIVLSAARELLMASATKRHAPVRAGRPRKAA